jgi:CheY-like chemotaxis protein/anti-sigma regulatory factor (Ser/Thr protein kinase)
MNGIMGFAQLLKDSQLSESQKEQYIGIMYNSSRQLLRIVNDVLDISKIETGQYEVHNEPFNVNDLMVELFTEFNSQAEYQDVRLYLYNAFSRENACIYTDRTKLRQILFNLLNNAYKFTSRGTIEFGYYSNENYLRFYVKDTGIGIPRDRLEQVFDRFNRGETPGNAQYGGTGLGLSISRGLVELLGGTMGVQSEEGEGSVFYFEIPHESGTNNCGASDSPEGESSSTTQDIKDILIVEDDEINAIFLNELLRDLGIGEDHFNIHHVYKGRDAVDFCRENPDLELVLMDIKLPDIDGLKATQSIKQSCPEMRIVAQTAHALDSERNRAIEGGFDDYISKPIDRHQLSGILKKYLDW